MKNQYFGDINDYRKYGLLRALQADDEGKLLVAWLLTPDDGGRDGKFRSYLQDPGRWQRYDPELFTNLTGLLQPTAMPAVSLIEGSHLLHNTIYYSTVVPDNRFERDDWRQQLLNAARNVDLVFLDPDNGIEVSSKPIGRKGSSKYVAWQELKALWQGGCSLLISQHFRRVPRAAFTHQLMSELRECTGARFTKALCTAHVVFLLAAQDHHAQRFEQTIDILSQRWHGQIEPIMVTSQHEAVSFFKMNENAGL